MSISIRIKLFSSFGIVIVVMIAMSFVMLRGFQNFQDNELALIELHEAHAQAQDIVWLNEVLTQSTRNYIFTSDTAWKERYDLFGARLDDTIKSAKARSVDQNIKSLFEKQDVANLTLVGLEVEAHDLVNNNQTQEALELIDGVKYSTWKSFYSNTVSEYLRISQRNLGSLIATNQAILQKLILSSYVFIVVALLISILLAYLISWHISKSLSRLQEGALEISRGNFNKKILVTSRDEFGKLAETFNDMAMQLSHSRANPKEKTFEQN